PPGTPGEVAAEEAEDQRAPGEGVDGAGQQGAGTRTEQAAPARAEHLLQLLLAGLRAPGRPG
ncbi:hypothetical protein ABZ630_25620, partial [Streptomyces albidoflavus]